MPTPLVLAHSDIRTFQRPCNLMQLQKKAYASRSTAHWTILIWLKRFYFQTNIGRQSVSDFREIKVTKSKFTLFFNNFESHLAFFSFLVFYPKFCQFTPFWKFWHIGGKVLKNILQYMMGIDKIFSCKRTIFLQRTMLSHKLCRACIETAISMHCANALVDIYDWFFLL